MGATLVRGCSLLDGEDLRLWEGAQHHNALIYRTFDHTDIGMPRPSAQIAKRLDQDRPWLAKLEQEAPGLPAVHDELQWELLRWRPRVARTRKDAWLIAKIAGRWQPQDPGFPSAIELETDMPDGPPLRWPARVTFVLTRASRQEPGVETIVGIEWRFKDATAANHVRLRGMAQR